MYLKSIIFFFLSLFFHLVTRPPRIIVVFGLSVKDQARLKFSITGDWNTSLNFLLLGDIVRGYCFGHFRKSSLLMNHSFCILTFKLSKILKKTSPTLFITRIINDIFDSTQCDYVVLNLILRTLVNYRVQARGWLTAKIYMMVDGDAMLYLTRTNLVVESRFFWGTKCQTRKNVRGNCSIIIVMLYY